MNGTNKRRHNLGAGFALWTYTAADGTEKAILARGGCPRDVSLWEGDYDALRRVVLAEDERRRARPLGELLQAGE